ncbi:hypothetical protein CCAX7_44500 [Capsulimonas corticalis]|uniref:Uncharacterized protein n=1 Tax=Capsulimonas corticalis TaxID=2219043 RepID=A0A402CX48_9BACT|nr:hypothetical protein [Capsulimonas corticalis]BDI32399.1 hypothetical protein CCAX7_44500 [Capsulimonas corticalis]
MLNFFAPIGVHQNPVGFYTHCVLGILGVLLFLGLLHAAPKQYRKTIIAFFTFVGGLYYVVEFFWPAQTSGPHAGENFLTPYQDFVANLSSVVQVFAVGLGVISLLQLHFKTLGRMKTGWHNSLALIVSFFAMTIFGIANEYYPKHPVAFGQTVHGIFQFLFIGGLNNLDSATFSMIAFFIASASYRAFRLRSVESSMMMTAALIVMLASTGFGTAITSHIPDGDSAWANFRIEHISEWLLTRVNAPAQRGILFGLTVGGLAVSLRLWLSLERGAYFDTEV